MIDEPPLLEIRRAFGRPPADLVAALAGTPTGYLVDCLNGRGAVDYAIKPLDPERAAFCGPALTCHAGPADNLALFAAVAEAKPGDVILCATDDCTVTGVTGDLLLGMARNRGVAALVTEGVVRDLAGVLKVGLPVFCRGVCANSPVRNGPGRVGLPVALGGVIVAAGDLVVGDRDGVVVVPQDFLPALPAQLARVKAAEAALEAKVAAGLEMLESIEALLRSDRVRVVE